MARCEKIRAAAEPYLDYIAQIEKESDVDARIGIGNKFTAAVVSALNNAGEKCTQSAADRVDFGIHSGCHVQYDILENLKGTKGSYCRLACIHVLSGTCGPGGTQPVDGANGGSGAFPGDVSGDFLSGGFIIPGTDVYVSNFLLLVLLIAILFIRR